MKPELILLGLTLTPSRQLQALLLLKIQMNSLLVGAFILLGAGNVVNNSDRNHPKVLDWLVTFSIIQSSGNNTLYRTHSFQLHLLTLALWILLKLLPELDSSSSRVDNTGTIGELCCPLFYWGTLLSSLFLCR